MSRVMAPITAAPRDIQRGFSLLEALVGLTVIAVAMLMTMSILAQQPWTERRLAAHHEALRLLELNLELMRSSLVRPQDGELDLSDLPRPQPAAAENLRIWAEVEKAPGRGLYQVTLTARHALAGRSYELVLETMVFTP